MIKIKSLIHLSFVAVLFSVLMACSTSESSIDTKTAVSSFLSKNDNIVAFGSADLDEILTKADYKSIPKLGMILSGEVESFKNLIDLDAPVYYAMEGPMNKEGVPEVTYGFLKVKSQDSLVERLVKMGYDIDETAELKVGQDEGFAVGIKNGLAIVAFKDGDFEAKEMLEKAFAMTEGDASGGKIDEILGAEGDIVMGVNVASLYNTSNTDLGKLDKDKIKEIEAMVAGSYVQTVFKFEDGAGIIETKNFFSDELSKRMFMNSDGKAPLMAKLGKGNPRFGVSVNIDMKKMQAFLDEFSPDAADQLARSMGGPAQMALMAGGSDGLAGIFNGKFGMVMMDDENGRGIKEPDFSMFIGLAPRGVDLGKMAQDFLSYGDSDVQLDQSGLSVFSNPSYAPPGKMNLPKGCENFGKNGINVFMNFDGLDFDDLDLEDEANVIRIIKYITVEYNNDGGRIYIKAKDGKENLLEQAMKEIVNELADEIGGISV